MFALIMNIHLTNTLSRQKELFKPLVENHVGIYVCGPTVYGDAHLGHARPEVVFDVMRRYFMHLGYKVRFVKNITDVGHLENDADHGEDKIAKKARLEQLEPMQVVQQYTLAYHKNRAQLNVLPPDIEPRASGHIPEQIEMIEQIIKQGFAYVSEGSVYFDVPKFAASHHYGKLSGRVLDDLLSETRELDGQKEKKHPADFALWKKAAPEHIMRWNSPWGVGFPGWHIECSAMSCKYLGETFDIHGGGMDLLFPHHECEIAQSVGSGGKEAVNYWVHNNMITINGQKMGKSLGNFITLDELFSGTHQLLNKAYSPMTVRFFMLQAHYGGTLDFSNEALEGAEKGLKRLLSAWEVLQSLQASSQSSADIQVAKLRQDLYQAMNDDINTPIVLSHLFEAVRWINSLDAKLMTISAADLKDLQKLLNDFLFDILGLQAEKKASNGATEGLMELIIQIRNQAKSSKDFQTSDLIRDQLKSLHITLQDSKEGTRWRQE